MYGHLDIVSKYLSKYFIHIFIHMNTEEPKSEIGERLDVIMEAHSIGSLRAMALSIGMDVSQLNKAYRGTLGLPSKWAMKIAETYGVSLDWLIKGKLPAVRTNDLDIYHQTHSKIVRTEAKEPDTSYTEERRIKKNLLERHRIPLYDAPASAGITEQDMTPVHAPSGTIDVGDLLHDSESAIRIYGNSMIPNYPPGCVVGLVKCSSNFIEPGEVYVIETRDRRLLKRVFYKNDDTSGESITLYSDNIMKFEGGARDGRLAYPPFDLPKSEIIALYQVTGVIKRNANSVILNR